MSKTPYEIRLEILKMAKDLMFEPIYQKRQTLVDEHHCKITDDNRASLSYPTLPDFPSSTDIVTKAEELKKFVDAA
jgi:hypothetical protein